MKNALIALGVIIILGGGLYLFSARKALAPAAGEYGTGATDIQHPSDSRYGDSTTSPTQSGKLKVANFSGTLQKVDTGCFSDGECFVVVDGKHVTTTLGWHQDEVGKILHGSSEYSIGDLEKHIGETVEVYAKDQGDGTYSLYGSAGFYVKLL